MNDENIKKMIEWVESSSSFIQGQIPDYIEQLLRYKMISTWLNVGILLIALIVSLSLWIFCLCKSSNYEKSYIISTPLALGCFMPAVIGFALFMGMISEIHDLIRLYIAPKVYVLNHLTSLLK